MAANQGNHIDEHDLARIEEMLEHTNAETFVSEEHSDHVDDSWFHTDHSDSDF